MSHTPSRTTATPGTAKVLAAHRATTIGQQAPLAAVWHAIRHDGRPIRNAPGLPPCLPGDDEQQWPYTADVDRWVDTWLAHIAIDPSIATDPVMLERWFLYAIEAGYEAACDDHDANAG